MDEAKFQPLFDKYAINGVLRTKILATLDWTGKPPESHYRALIALRKSDATISSVFFVELATLTGETMVKGTTRKPKAVGVATHKVEVVGHRKDGLVIKVLIPWDEIMRHMPHAGGSLEMSAVEIEQEKIIPEVVPKVIDVVAATVGDEDPDVYDKFQKAISDPDKGSLWDMVLFAITGGPNKVSLDIIAANCKSDKLAVRDIILTGYRQLSKHIDIRLDGDYVSARLKF